MEVEITEGTLSRIEAAAGDNGRLISLLEDMRLMDGVQRVRKAEEALYEAMNGRPEVFQMMVDAVSKEVILPVDPGARCALTRALEQGPKTAVLALVERMKKEGYERKRWLVNALFDSDHFQDDEVVDAVISVLPPATFGPEPPVDFLDCLQDALHCRVEHRERAVEMCLRLGPPMAVRLEGWNRFLYVFTAARLCDLAMVKKMHDLVPLLPDGLGRRGTDEDYTAALEFAAENSSDVAAIMEFLVEQCGDHVLDLCDPEMVLNVPREEDVEWLITRAPRLLQRLCEHDGGLYSLLWRNPSPMTVMEHIAKLVDTEVIAKFMRQELKSDLRRRFGEDGWRWKLEVLHKALPGCVDDELRFHWLTQAIRDKAYRDVEYMLGMCSRKHLVMRTKEGDTAYDLAARNQHLPLEVLRLLKVEAKGAHS